MSEFHELRGDYVENAGQQINLHGYLDYFEPLGSALSRLPDGTGGPFVYQFTAGRRTIGSIGWVVSAASKRFGGWKLWGMWSEQPIPAIALPLFWPMLADPSRAGDIVARANRDADRLADRGEWRKLAGEIKPARLRDKSFRELLKAELSRAWAAQKQPIEVELSPPMLDLLPWLYVLGPVDPTQAQIQPSRFNGAGYQYIVSDREPRDAEIASDVETIVDAAADDVARGWSLANELRRARDARARPKPKPKPKPVPPAREEEETEMPTRKPPLDIAALLNAALQLLVIVLLAWILWELRAIRKNTEPRPEPEPIAASAPVPAPAPVVEENPIRDLARALAANPPTGIRVSPAALDESRDTLARAAVEVFMRRNTCFNRAEAVDGKISTAEQRAIRTCTSLRTERLVSSSGQIDATRAIAWLERTVR